MKMNKQLLYAIAFLVGNVSILSRATDYPTTVTNYSAKPITIVTICLNNPDGPKWSWVIGNTQSVAAAPSPTHPTIQNLTLSGCAEGQFVILKPLGIQGDPLSIVTQDQLATQGNINADQQNNQGPYIDQNTSYGYFINIVSGANYNYETNEITDTTIINISANGTITTKLQPIAKSVSKPSTGKQKKPVKKIRKKIATKSSEKKK